MIGPGTPLRADGVYIHRLTRSEFVLVGVVECQSTGLRKGVSMVVYRPILVKRLHLGGFVVLEEEFRTWFDERPTRKGRKSN